MILLIVGGEADQIETYRRIAREIGVDDMVDFVGMVNPGDVESYYRIADALISTRIKGTNTPLKIYKYLMSGKPVIATRIWSHTQVLNEDIAILVDIDEKDVSEKLRSIVTDRDLLKMVEKNARAYVKEHFSYDGYLRLTNSIYESVF